MENTRCKCAGSRMTARSAASSCACSQTGSEDCTFVSVPTTAIVYIAMQEFKDLYDPCVGFGRGTIFAELDKPWLAGGCGYGK